MTQETAHMPLDDRGLVRRWGVSWCAMHGSQPHMGCTIWAVSADGTKSRQIAYIGPKEYRLDAGQKIADAHNSAITDLEAENAKLRQTLSASNAALEAENERLREALAFYADIGKYPAPVTGRYGELYYDCGAIARAALSAPKGGQDA